MHDIVGCEPCTGQSYNLQYGSSICIPCPDHAICTSNSVSPLKGYWLSKDNYHTYLCNNDHCTGGDVCSGSRDPMYPMCNACLDGYTNWFNKCVSKLTITICT